MNKDNNLTEKELGLTTKVTNLTANDCSLLNIINDETINISESLLLEYYDLAMEYEDMELAIKLIKNYKGNKIKEVTWK